MTILQKMYIFEKENFYIHTYFHVSPLVYILINIRINGALVYLYIIEKTNDWIQNGWVIVIQLIE